MEKLLLGDREPRSDAAETDQRLVVYIELTYYDKLIVWQGKKA